jgi:citrate synthase
MTYAPAFLNTASCRSAITYLDGERGILRYRGYPIEDLAENCSFLEAAYLLLSGELPTEPALQEWTQEVKRHTLIHENIKKVIDGFHSDAHPMGILIATVAALSTFYPEAVGWLAQWQEMLEDPEQKIARPRQIYTGPDRRDFLAMRDRSTPALAAC